MQDRRGKRPGRAAAGRGGVEGRVRRRDPGRVRRMGRRPLRRPPWSAVLLRTECRPRGATKKRYVKALVHGDGLWSSYALRVGAREVLYDQRLRKALRRSEDDDLYQKMIDAAVKLGARVEG